LFVFILNTFFSQKLLLAYYSQFKESFQTSFKKSMIDSLYIDFKEIYFVPNKKKKTVSLNKLKKNTF
jgi:hypothetical protein